MFVLPPHDITVLEGEQFLLMCSTKGKPAPEVTWYKDGEPIEDDDNTMTSSEQDLKTLQTASKLLVQRADIEKHDGKMVVEVKNEVGEAVHEVEVTGENSLDLLVMQQ